LLAYWNAFRFHLCLYKLLPPHVMARSNWNTSHLFLSLFCVHVTSWWIVMKVCWWKWNAF